jgi:murein DD-endopeptidase MepM/ murein hydrolase activator NlpD
VSGTPIVAPEDGKLTFTNDGLSGPAGCPPPYSFHLQGRSGTFYFGTHLLAFTGGSLGDSRDVIAGEQIGEVGNGGNACGTASHLHFETHVNGVPVDPYPALVKAARLTAAVA